MSNGDSLAVKPVREAPLVAMCCRVTPRNNG